MNAFLCTVQQQCCLRNCASVCTCGKVSCKKIWMKSCLGPATCSLNLYYLQISSVSERQNSMIKSNTNAFDFWYYYGLDNEKVLFIGWFHVEAWCNSMLKGVICSPEWLLSAIQSTAKSTSPTPNYLSTRQFNQYNKPYSNLSEIQRTRLPKATQPNYIVSKLWNIYIPQFISCGISVSPRSEAGILDLLVPMMLRASGII